jgi:CTP synthase (UTP-ammonia lyase)
MQTKRIGLVGDFNPDVIAHRAIPAALALAAKATGVSVEPVWLATDRIEIGNHSFLSGFAGLWCVPASPYANMEGALSAIRYAREYQIPFLGTCGGFQHALIEYARNVAGLCDAEHAETNPDASNLVISPLACSLVEQTGTIRLKKNSLICNACGSEQIVEGYHCRFGLNPVFRERLEAGELQFTGWDENGDVRAFELRGHPFFVATLFQPERAALRGESHPLIHAFVEAACVRASGSP